MHSKPAPFQLKRSTLGFRGLTGYFSVATAKSRGRSGAGNILNGGSARNPSSRSTPMNKARGERGFFGRFGEQQLENLVLISEASGAIARSYDEINPRSSEAYISALGVLTVARWVSQADRPCPPSAAWRALRAGAVADWSRDDPIASCQI